MNTPNKLTVARMILVPFLVIFMLTGWGREANRWICLAIFVAASVTDWFDGHLARKYNLITNFGKFMDPLADKLLVCSAMICMIEVDKLPAWVVIIIIGREFIISGFRLIAAENGIVNCRKLLGKIQNRFPDDHDHTSDAGFRRCFCSADTDIYLAVRCTDHYFPADLYHAEQKGPFHAGVGIRVYERSFFS